MKIYKIILILIISVFVFNGCGGGSKSSFVRPYDNYEQFTLKMFQGEKLVNINVPSAKGFSWKQTSKINGHLEFELFFKTGRGNNWDKREMKLIVTKNKDIMLSLDLEKDAFNEVESDCIYRKFIKTAVSLKSGDILRFFINDNFHLPRDNFDMINLIIIPDKGPDHSKNKNILLITIDTLRADYMGYYRKLKGLYPDKISFSPNLDKIANENLVFTKAYTPIASTWPALTSIAKSRMPFEHGVQKNGALLENEKGSLAHHLFNSWYNVSFRANAFQMNLGGFDKVKSFFRKDKKLKNNAKSFLVENYKKKFFLWLHFLGVHSGYRPSKAMLSRIEPDGYTGNVQKAVGPVLKRITAGEKIVTENDIEHIRNCYAGELLQLDEWIKEIFDVMKEKKIWDNTLIIISADHGEDLHQHNKHFFHYPSIYNTSLHVPLIIKFPNSEYKGVIDQNVSLLDFMPTILDYYKIKTDYRMTGESLMPLIRKDVKSRNRYLFAESENNRILSIIGAKWKYIYNPDGLIPKTQYRNPYPIGIEEFYNLEADRYEASDLMKGTLPNIYKKLKFNLINYIKAFQLDKKKKDRKKVSEMSEEVKKELRTLGYI
ncbi:MAG: sulfatase [Acidobacteriota bacterium]